MKIRDIMTPSVATVNIDATIDNVAKIMKQHNIGSVPVVGENASLQGIITDRDIVIRNIAGGKDPKTEKVRDVMTTNVSTVTPETEVSDAVKLMADLQIRRLPVVDNGSLVGIAAIGDVAVTGDYKVEVSSALTDISEGCNWK